MKRKFLAGLMVSAVLCAGTATATVLASAEEAPVEAPAVSLTFDGASIRLGADDGIRFAFNVNNWTENSGYTYGMYIMSASKDITGLTFDGNPVAGTAYSEIPDAKIKEAGKQMRGVYSGPSEGVSFEGNYGTDLKAVAIVMKDGEVVTSLESEARSAAYVAKETFKDYTNTYDGENTGYLVNYFNGIEGSIDSIETLADNAGYVLKVGAKDNAWVEDGQYMQGTENDTEEVYRLIDGKTYTRTGRINAAAKKIVICGNGTIDFDYSAQNGDETAMSVYASQLIVGAEVVMNATSIANGYAHTLALVGSGNSEFYGTVNVSAPEGCNAIYLENSASCVLHNKVTIESGALTDNAGNGNFVLASEVYNADYTVNGDLYCIGSTINGNLSVTGTLTFNGKSKVTANSIVANTVKFVGENTTLVREKGSEGNFINAPQGQTNINVHLANGVIKFYNLGNEGVNVFGSEQINLRKGSVANDNYDSGVESVSVYLANFAWLQRGTFSGNDNDWQKHTFNSVFGSDGCGVIFHTGLGADWTYDHSKAAINYYKRPNTTLDSEDAIEAFFANPGDGTGEGEANANKAATISE